MEGQGCDFRNSGLIIIEIDGQQKHNAEGNILKFEALVFHITNKFGSKFNL